MELEGRIKRLETEVHSVEEQEGTLSEKERNLENVVYSDLSRKKNGEKLS